MHGTAGLHSALAIKRQRRQRMEAKRRERERRLSSRTDSTDSVDHLAPKPAHHQPPPVTHSIGMLHIGICFLVFGLFLIGSGLLPDDLVTWRGGGWWNELVASGIFMTALGVFLVALNRVVSRREENDLNDYVQRQLTRSKSGHRLERDVETGCLTTKHHRRFIEKRREDRERGLELTPVHSPHAKLAPTNSLQNGEAQLEKIVEEDALEYSLRPSMVMMENNRETVSTTTTASLSPGTPSETKELISSSRQHSFNSRQY